MAFGATTGAGASAFLTGATSYIVDISNPLNRARSMAPLYSAFSAGAALGKCTSGGETIIKLAWTTLSMRSMDVNPMQVR